MTSIRVFDELLDKRMFIRASRSVNRTNIAPAVSRTPRIHALTLEHAMVLAASVRKPAAWWQLDLADFSVFARNHEGKAEG